MFCKIYLHFLIFILLFQIIFASENKHIIIEETGLKPLFKNSIGIVFYVNINNTSPHEKYDLEILPDKCCLHLGQKEYDCDIMKIFGGDFGVIHNKSKRSMLLVYPTLYTLNRDGICYVTIKSHLHSKRKTMRNQAKIYFNTKISNLKSKKEVNEFFTKHEIPEENITFCDSDDEDPLKSCEKVDCEIFYDGKRSFFNYRTKRCVSVPECINENPTAKSKFVLNPAKNKCIVAKKLNAVDKQKFKSYLETASKKVNTDGSTNALFQSNKNVFIINTEGKEEYDTERSISVLTNSIPPNDVRVKISANKSNKSIPAVNYVLKDNDWALAPSFPYLFTLCYPRTPLAMFILGLCIGIQIAFIWLVLILIIKFIQHLIANKKPGPSKPSDSLLSNRDKKGDIISYQSISTQNMGPSSKVYRSDIYRQTLNSCGTSPSSSLLSKEGEVLEEGLQTEFVKDSLDDFILRKHGAMIENATKVSGNCKNTSKWSGPSKNSLLKEIISRLHLNPMNYGTLKDEETIIDEDDVELSVASPKRPTGLGRKKSSDIISGSPSEIDKVESDVRVETIHLKNSGELSSSVYEDSDYLRKIKSLHVSRSSM